MVTTYNSNGEPFRDCVPQLQPEMTYLAQRASIFINIVVTFQFIKMTFRLVYLSFVLTRGWNNKNLKLAISLL